MDKRGPRCRIHETAAQTRSVLECRRGENKDEIFALASSVIRLELFSIYFYSSKASVAGTLSWSRRARYDKQLHPATPAQQMLLTCVTRVLYRILHIASFKTHFYIKNNLCNYIVINSGFSCFNSLNNNNFSSVYFR